MAGIEQETYGNKLAPYVVYTRWHDTMYSPIS